IGKRGDGLRFKDILDRQLYSEAIPYPRNHLHSKKRIAAEIKDSVVDPDLLRSEKFLPDKQQFPFAIISGRLTRRILTLPDLQIGKRATIDLTIDIQRKFAQEAILGRDHIVRQLTRYVLA